jgi:hypothetical protein
VSIPRYILEYPNLQKAEIENLAGLFQEQVLSYVCENKSYNQRGANIMAYAMSKFQMQINENEKFSSMGGGVLVSLMFEKMRLRQVINESLGVCRQSNSVKYTDSSYVESLVIMQLLGGDTVDDIKGMREDSILPDILGGIPSKTSIHNYIENFVDKNEEEKRGQGKSVVPKPNEHLNGFDSVTKHLLKQSPHVKEISTITLDQDATFIPTGVMGALYNYKSYRSFEAFNTYSPEYDMIIRSEFRDGNVSPGYMQLDNLKASLELLPDSVKKVRLRSDTAGYQADVLKYCAEGKSEKFGVIDFAIGSPVTKVLKQAIQAVPESEWKSIPDTTQECAEVIFVPNSLGTTKNSSEYRFIATREELGDSAPPELLQMKLWDDEEIGKLPIASVHPTLMNGTIYKVFALVTNLDLAAEEVVVWYRKRCGKSEEIHRVLKDELAGGHVVTSALGANAAWWQITILSFNILTLIKRICLGEEYQTSRPKKLRYCLFGLVVRLGTHARKMTLTLYSCAQTCLFTMAWNRLNNLQVRME